MRLDPADKAILAVIVARPGVGLAGVLKALAEIAVEEEGRSPAGPEKERWGQGFSICADASLLAHQAGL